MQQVLDRRSALIILVFSLPLLFFPKINLISFEQETAGLRLDDLILLGFSLICFWANFSVRKKITDIEIALFAIVGFSLFSFSINRLLFAAEIMPVRSSFFYCFRILEYFSFFYIGSLAFRFFRIESIVKAFFVWNLVLMILQKLQIVGIFSVEGYIAKPDDRMLGIASFGSEIGLLLNLLFCFLIYQSKTTQARYILMPGELKRFLRTVYPYALLLLFIFLVVLSGARMAIFALFVSFILCVKDLIDWRKPFTFILPLLTLAIGAGLMVVALYKASGIVERSAGLLSMNNFELITTVWDNIALDYDPIGKESVRQGLQTDTSWWMRIHKWCYVLKIYWLHPESWLQGVGPGFAMPALDGGYLRILTELGLIGCGLYGRLFYLIAKQTPQLYWMMIAFLLNMLFFDVYLAYKPMSLIFLIVGYAYAAKEKRVDLSTDEIVSVALAQK